MRSLDISERITEQPVPVVPQQSQSQPQPCPTCRCPKAWFDHYGGGPHCFECKPPPTKSMIRRQCDVITTSNGSFAWSDETPPEELSEVDLELEFDRKYRCYETRDGKRFVTERRDWSFLWDMIH